MSHRTLGCTIRRHAGAAVAAVVLVSAAPAAQRPDPVTADRAAQATEQQQAAALCDAGEAYYHRTQYASARTQVSQCAEIFDRLASQAGIGRANQLLSMIAGMTGDLGEAAKRARRALAAYEAAGDVRGRAGATLQIVRVATLEPGEDLRLLRGVIAEVREIGDRAIEARALHSLADHLFTAGSVPRTRSRC